MRRRKERANCRVAFLNGLRCVQIGKNKVREKAGKNTVGRARISAKNEQYHLKAKTAKKWHIYKKHKFLHKKHKCEIMVRFVPFLRKKAHHVRVYAPFSTKNGAFFIIHCPIVDYCLCDNIVI